MLPGVRSSEREVQAKKSIRNNVQADAAAGTVTNETGKKGCEKMKPGGHYRKGYEFERVVKKVLEERGCYVGRSAGSHGVDLIVVAKTGRVTFVSCKAYQRVAQSELNEIGEVAEAYSGTAMLAIPGTSLKKPVLKYVLKYKGNWVA